MSVRFAASLVARWLGPVDGARFASAGLARELRAQCVAWRRAHACRHVLRRLSTHAAVGRLVRRARQRARQRARDRARDWKFERYIREGSGP